MSAYVLRERLIFNPRYVNPILLPEISTSGMHLLEILNH
jgi:hypothetical protein